MIRTLYEERKVISLPVASFLIFSVTVNTVSSRTAEEELNWVREVKESM